jgi:LPXTG-site transpeptidase (sortase) family protein
VLLGAWLLPIAAGQWRQHQADVRWAESDAFDAANRRPAIVPPPPGLARPVDGVDFRLRVPRLGYQALVHEGVSSDSLFGGPGHYPQSRWPGQSGSVAVAAHNVYWLRFDELKRDDQVIVETRYGAFRYRVTDTQVVGPDDRSVLADAPGRRLTLTTCWPLWAGQFATSRLAIFAA